MVRNENFTYFEEGERFITLSFRGFDEETVYIPYVNINAIDNKGNIYFTSGSLECILYVDNMRLEECENPEDEYSPVVMYRVCDYFISVSNDSYSLTSLSEINNNNNN